MDEFDKLIASLSEEPKQNKIQEVEIKQEPVSQNLIVEDIKSQKCDDANEYLVDSTPILNKDEQEKRIKEAQQLYGDEMDISFGDDGIMHVKKKVPESSKFPTPNYDKFNDTYYDIFDKRNPNKQRRDALIEEVDAKSIAKAEEEFINFVLDYELELKEFKNAYKMKTMEYQSRGVNTRVVTSTMKKIAKDIKKDPISAKDEENIYNRIYQNKDILEKIKFSLN